MERSLTDLPKELQLEILVRLPLKTLFVSKCVCRSFYDVTALDAHFIESHSSNAPQSLAFQFGADYRPSRRIQMLEPELLNFEFTPIFQVPDGDRVIVNRFLLVNSCNGLLYFCQRLVPNLYTIVCNPVLSEYVHIQAEINPDSDSVLRSSWLGFDSSINAYKFLLIFSSKTYESVLNSFVLDLLSHSERYVKNTLLGSDHSWSSNSTVVNGAIHWFDSSQDDIVLFDFEKEKYGKVALPLEGQLVLGAKNCMSIGVLEGCLAFSFNNFLANRVSVWVMEKPGNRDIWSKRFVVDTATPTRRLLSGQFKPLQILRNGELLMLWGRRDLACYDQKNERFRLVGFRGMNANRVIVFTPNFVPLKDTPGLGVDSAMVQSQKPFISLKDTLRPPQSLAIQFVEAVGPSRHIHIFEPRIKDPEFRPTFKVPSETGGSSGVNRFSLVNSCNGVLYFCVKHTADVYSLMCNPVTHETVRINLEDSLVPRSQWLGFDSINKQYKVLMVLSSSRDESKGLDSYVLKLPSGSSRYIKNTPLGSEHSWDASNTFVNGVIHWFDSSQEAIVMFDFVKEMFGEVALPPEEQLGNKECMSIGVLNGCLALSHNDFSKHCVNIWVRETHENQQCWKKEYAIDTETLTNWGAPLHEQFKPLQILRNGRLLILLGNEDLVYSDPEYTGFQLLLIGQGIHRAAVVFTPSFVYLKDAVGIDNVMVQNVRPSDGGTSKAKEVEDAKKNDS